MGTIALPHRVLQTYTVCRIYNLINKSNGVIIREQILLQSSQRLHRSSLLFTGSWEDNGADKIKGIHQQHTRGHCCEETVNSLYDTARFHQKRLSLTRFSFELSGTVCPFTVLYKTYTTCAWVLSN